MKVDCELDKNEHTAMLLMLGMATGIYAMEGKHELAKTCVRVVNKLLAHSANFIPYDPDSFDPKREGFPFASYKRQ